MSEALRVSLPALAPAIGHDQLLADPLPDVPPVEDNDNEIVASPQEGEQRMFEMPAGVWKAMIACYGVFLAALLGATGGGHAAFAIAIAFLYVGVFFGTAKILLRQAPPQPRSQLNCPDAVLQTAYGPLKRSEAFAQMLVVPAAIASFGIAFMILSIFLM